MAKELKIHLTDRAATEAAIRELGADYIGESHSVHTYFVQPAGKVLKTVESDADLKLLELESQGSGFVLMSSRILEANDPRIAQYTAKFGISAVLDMRSWGFMLSGTKLETYHILGVGEFLIQTAEIPDPDLFAKIGIPKALYVTVPFNELPHQN